MASIGDTIIRGAGFVRKSPQLLYTVFLLITIPVAFLATSENFLRVARSNQDRLEQTRLGLMQDVFASFGGTMVSDPDLLRSHMSEVASRNETIVGFRILAPKTDGRYEVIASLDEAEQGTVSEVDPYTDFVLRAALMEPAGAFSRPYVQGGVRHWRSARAMDVPGASPVLLLTDLAMAEADATARRNIASAYVILAFIVILIVLLLARQARIVDYVALYRRLQEVDRMKDDFVSMAAHELRSPLTVIRGYVDLLRGTPLNDEGRSVLEKIEMFTGQLNTLIGDILDVSRLQEGRMKFEPRVVPLRPEIESVSASFQKPAKDKGLSLSVEIEEEPAIRVDPDRLRQALINLIGNAIKYTPAGSVRVRLARVRGGRVEIRVSDTGLGISAEDQHRIFEKFFRVRSKETETIVGTGLGLWITAEMIRQMNGTIAVESIKGKGSDFILIFPEVSPEKE
jgi:signal transduction histidine kinase